MKNLLETKHMTWNRVKYFHPEGKSMPNGSHYQRGGFLQECKQNTNSFVLDEGIHSNQCGMTKYMGGIIVFSTDVNAIETDSVKSLNKINRAIDTYINRLNKRPIIRNVVNRIFAEGGECIGTYGVGNFFKGKYVGDKGEMYNEQSLAVEINGLSSGSLLNVAEMIAHAFMQKSVLVKDLNKGNGSNILYGCMHTSFYR